MTTWRKVGYCLAVAAMCGVTAAFGEEELGPVGGRVRGVVRTMDQTLSSSIGRHDNIWTPFDENVDPSISTDWNWAGPYVYDVGSPMVVERLGMVLRNLAPHGANRAKYWTCYGSNDKDNLKGECLFSNEGTELAYGVTNWFANASATPYRYYAFYPGSNCLPNWHVLYFSSAMQVSQNRVDTFASRTIGAEDNPNGPLFTGEVRYLPNGGTADVVLCVARTDHDCDYAAWLADATLKTYRSEGLAQGENWSINAGGLETGRWFARAFLVQGDAVAASQVSSEFALGTSAYVPTAYFPSNVGQGWKVFDGNLSTMPDINSAASIFFALDDPDCEVAGVRLFPRNDVLWRYRSIFARFCYGTKAGDFGAVADITDCKTRTLKTAERDPLASDDWTRVMCLQEADYYFYRAESYVEHPIHIPSVCPTLLRMDNVVYNFCDVELRTLPRPPEPVATMELGTVGGTYVGLSGYLTYRGNAASDCEVYVSCVPEGDEKSYVKIADGWTSRTAWLGAVQGLQGETDYDIDVIVSNALAGVNVLSTQFTTPQAVDEPPQLTFLAVTPNLDGTVTFDWNLVSFGTGGTSADIYMKWGADAEHLGDGVLIASASALGNGSAATDEVPCGEALVFALYAVSDSERTSEETEPRSATTYGPSSFGTLTQKRDGERSVRITGEVVPGLGETFVYMNWGLSPSDLSNWTLLGTYTKDTPSKAISSLQTLNVRGMAYVCVVASNEWKGTSWISCSATNSYLLGTWLPAHVQTANGSTKAYVVHDGDALTWIEEAGSDPCTFDLGSPHKLTGAIFQMRSDGNGDKNWAKTFSVLTSLDGVTYQQAWSNETAVIPEKGVMTDMPFPADWPLARYVRFTHANAKNTTSQPAELMVVGEDLALKADVVRTWGTSAEPAANASDDSRGLYFTGKLLDGGPAKVYACAASRDCGSDAAAWLAGGYSAEVGTYSAGESVSGWLPGVPAGTYHVRLVAIGADQSAVSPEKRTVAVGTKLCPAELHISSSATNLKVAYDAATGSNVDSCSGEYFYFKLPDMQSYRPTSVRVWPRSGWIKRTCVLQLDITDDKTALNLTDYSSSATRVIKTFTSNPLSGWQRVTRAVDALTVQSTDTYWDIPLGRIPANMTYLRLYAGENNNIREVELRMNGKKGLLVVVR